MAKFINRVASIFYFAKLIITWVISTKSMPKTRIYEWNGRSQMQIFNRNDLINSHLFFCFFFSLRVVVLMLLDFALTAKITKNLKFIQRLRERCENRCKNLVHFTLGCRFRDYRRHHCEREKRPQNRQCFCCCCFCFT